jgi:hypothetical protein
MFNLDKPLLIIYTMGQRIFSRAKEGSYNNEETSADETSAASSNDNFIGCTKKSI